MENASQALNIAAGVLIGVLILSLLVVFYNNIKDWQRNDEMATYQEQSAEFNKEYDVYVRTLYGSELLSLVNKAADYNKTESEQKGYSRLDIIITFKNSYDVVGFKKNGKYSTDDIIAKISALQTKIENYGKKTYKGKTISQLALMRTNELKQFIVDNNLNASKAEEINEMIQQYTNAKSDEVTIKSKEFKYVNSEYDSTTGRVKKMEYKEQ